MALWWHGPERDEAVCWTLTRNGQTAVCRLVSSRSGRELRFEIDGEFLMSQHVGDDADVAERQRAWRRALEAKGWTA